MKPNQHLSPSHCRELQDSPHRQTINLVNVFKIPHYIEMFRDLGPAVHEDLFLTSFELPCKTGPTLGLRTLTGVPII